MTLIEVVVMIVVLGILAVVFLPAFDRGQVKAPRINCVNNLKEIGLAYRIWAGDNNDKYPMEVSVTNGGAMELVADGENVWLNYLVMSNELSTPKILYCPADTDHTRATNFTTDFNNSKISYFVGLDADQKYPQMLLSGDNNFEVGGVPVKSGSLKFSTNTPIAWSAGRHKFAGNIGLADGSVYQVTSVSLHQWLLPQTGLATNHLAIP